MIMKHTIAAKVFGLAVVLLSLTIGLVGSLLWQVTELNRRLNDMATHFGPLAGSAANIDEYGLRRRLAFERWLAALNRPEPDTTILAEARTNYGLFTDRLKDELERAKQLAELPAEDENGRQALVEVRTSLRQIEAQYVIISRQQRDVLELMSSGQPTRAKDILRGLNDSQRLVQEERERIQNLTQEFVGAATLEATNRQKRVVWVSLAATVTSVLLGLTLSALVTRRLVRPVRSLITGIKSIEQGDLSVELPVRSTDEVGDLTHAFNFFVREMRAKDQIKRTFGKYVDPRVLDRIILQPGTADTASGRHEMSVAFSDLVGFTSLGELLTPGGMVNVLNRHFTLQAEAIQNHHGVIDKFMGDGVMAFWGPPFSTEQEHAAQACRAAVEQLKVLKEFRAMLPELTGLRRNLPIVDLRIGICTGDVIAGNIGSENTRSYTVIGDTVNLASRLEHANRIYGTRILATESTIQAAGTDFLVREIDALVVKGKSEAHRVFEILGVNGEVPDEWQRLCERFASALTAYRALHWDGAESELRGCLELRRDDGPSLALLERISRYRETPPPADWDGTFQLDSK